MRSRRFIALHLRIVFLAALALPAHAEILTIPGSGTPTAALAALAADFHIFQPQHQVMIPKSTGIAGGLRALDSGEATVARIARRLTDQEKKSGLGEFHYANDAVVFVGGANVTVKNLSRAQLADIFSGKITNWRQVGGHDAPIRVLVREPTEIAFRAIKKAIPSFENLKFTDDAKLANFDSEMQELLEKFKNAIGWLTHSQIVAHQISGSTNLLQPLAIDGVGASVQTLRNNTYKLSVEHVLIYRQSGLTQASKDFMAFIRSSAGRRVLDKHQLMAIEK